MADQTDNATALQWYDITNQTIAAAGYPEPVTQSRAWSVSWLAAARAVGRHGDSSFGVAAFAQALHDTLAVQVPGQQSQLDADLAQTLSAIPDGPAKSAGIAAGAQQAREVLTERQGDGLDTASVDTPFTAPPAGPGVWQPTPPTFGPATRAGEGDARPFLLASADQFDPGPPPSLSSRTYRTGLAEVRTYGSVTSVVRTADQTDIALFWEPAINIQFVQVLRAVLADTRAPLAWQAQFVAAFNVVTTDAQIAIYHAKFKYLFWRPVTAIRTGSIDPDPSWTPLFTTPRYPDWPSGHGGVAGAAQEVLTAFLGPNAPSPIEVTSPTDPGSTQTYDRWSQITRQVIDARVWEGIHFRFSDVAGARLGDDVARYDLHHLRSLGL
ncbi:MAG: vanadium-dependent haloperoxidase [Pseudonocardia sp.]|nr:vanadium-dependent haloperoxidase [Pseudonocardia sp.]